MTNSDKEKTKTENIHQEMNMAELSSYIFLFSEINTVILSLSIPTTRIKNTCFQYTPSAQGKKQTDQGRTYVERNYPPA